MSDIKLKTFPDGLSSALTMLYLDQTDISGLTPEELYERYVNVCGRISNCAKVDRNRRAEKNLSNLIDSR